MPSSNKTLFLQLNKWLGNDKPKKDDFNNDNQKLDDCCKSLSQSIGKLEAEQNAKASTQTVTNLSNSVTSHTSNNTVHVTAAERTAWAATNSNLNATNSNLNTTNSNLSSHTSNGTVHITAAERTAWSSGAGFVCGSYSGNGAASRKITLGYKPRYGVIFVAGDGAGRIMWSNEQYIAQCGMLSTLGCSKGITLNADGFTVEQLAAGGLDGFGYKFNTSGATYVYFLWK